MPPGWMADRDVAGLIRQLQASISFGNRIIDGIVNNSYVRTFVVNFLGGIGTA